MTSLPPLLMTSDKGSFARLTIEDRKPAIIDSLMTNIDYPLPIREALNNLKNELVSGLIQPLKEATRDRAFWNNALIPFQNKSWLELPWYLAETYFFRRVLEAILYFQPGPWHLKDPYEFLKEKELTNGMQILSTNLSLNRGQSQGERFQFACYQALWGNRGDLSNMDSFVTDMGHQTERIILDQSKKAYLYLKKNPGSVAYFMDNVGTELLFDLVLIDFLLETGLTRSVTCFVKNQPFYVSDAMMKDVLRSIETMHTSTRKEISQLGMRLQSYIKSGKLSLKAPTFLTSNLMYSEMPEELYQTVAAHTLIILKGDVNYRRLFGDRRWPHTRLVVQAAGYFPASFLSLRTLKSELVLGISKKILDQIIQEADPNWMTNGKRGMITFLERTVPS